MTSFSFFSTVTFSSAVSHTGSFLFYALSFLIVLSIIVVVHEMGHFLAARMSGVRVETFSLGFGKEIWGRTDKKGTRWKIAPIPFGGYVKLFGDEDASSSKASEESKTFSEDERKVSFPHQPRWKKAFIVFSGPMTNYLFAIVVLAALFAAYGRIRIEPVIGGLVPDSPAAKAGLMKDDKVVLINGNEIMEYGDIPRELLLSTEQRAKVVVERKGERRTFVLTPETSSGTPKIGIYSSPGKVTYEKLGPVSALVEAVVQTWQSTRDTIVFVGQMIKRDRNTDELRGPLGIAEISGDIAKQGFLPMIFFIAQISIAIGLVNLFPIPLLDGGQLMILGVEGVLRRELSEKMQIFLSYVGYFFLIFLVVLTFYKDIPRIFTRIFGP